MVQTDKMQSLVCELKEIHKMEAELKTADLLDPVPNMIDASYKGVDIDIICVSKKWESESLQHTINIDIDGKQIPVVDPYYLAILKLKAGGPQNLLDVKNMLDNCDFVEMDKLAGLAKKFKVSRLLKKAQSF